MPFPPLPTQVSCPQCNARFVVQVRTIIDVAEKPELKEQFLRGRINYAQCPQCGGGGLLSTPLVYHDPSKELLISYLPPELAMSADEREQYVGSLVQSVMNSLPPEQRKGYFLQPKTALTLDSMFDAILEADGISKEALRDQRAKLDLVNRLLAAVDDQESLGQLIEEHRAELSYEFFLLLSSVIDASGEDGNEERGEALRNLREKLLERVNPMPSVAPEGATYDELIEMLRVTDKGEAWHTTIALNRPRLDYGFFQALTAKSDAAESAGDSEVAQELKDLRRRILDEMDAQDATVRQAEDKASLLIMQLSEAEDLQSAVREHRDEINHIFISVVARYQATARAQEDDARAEKLGLILEAALNVLEEGLPPDIRLINRLLRAEHPDGTDAVLEEQRGDLNDAFLAMYDRYAASLEGDEEAETTEHLKKVRAQIVAKMSVLRG